MLDEKINMGFGFSSSKDSFLELERYNKDKNKNRLSYGVPYLDDISNGISKSELVLVGGRTGCGKTELVTSIAAHNALLGKNVYFFALEAERFEIQNRIASRMLFDVYRNIDTGFKKKDRFSYKDLQNGLYDSFLERFYPEVYEQLSEQYKTLFVKYKLGKFDLDDLRKDLFAIQLQADLIVIDHLQYVDIVDPNENKAIKEIMQTIRTIVLDIQKPVILVSHLRKADRFNKSIVPDLDDFHGSSDIPKTSTTSIMISPAYDYKSDSDSIFPTYMRLAKCREEGSRARYVSLNKFDVRGNKYLDQYSIGLFKESLDEFKEITDSGDLPHWYQRGLRNG